MYRTGFLMLFVGLVVGYIIASGMIEAPSTPAAATVGEVRFSMERVQDESETTIVRAEYPVFGISTIDAAIESRVKSAIAEFRKDAAGPLMTSAKNEFIGLFDSAYVGADVVSVKLILSPYTGGAHPNAVIAGLNFDRATGRTLTQSDMLSLTGLTLEEMAAQATARLQEKLGEGMFVEGAAATPDNYSTFVISADAVTVYFQNYQVAAYAAGPQEVVFDRVK